MFKNHVLVLLYSVYGEIGPEIVSLAKAIAQNPRPEFYDFCIHMFGDLENEDIGKEFLTLLSQNCTFVHVYWYSLREFMFCCV